MKKLSKKVPFFKYKSDAGVHGIKSVPEGRAASPQGFTGGFAARPLQRLFYNQILDKKGTKKILSWFLENYGPTRTSQFIEELKSVGFHFATEAGLSLGFDDLRIPIKKSVLLNTAELDVLECEKRYFQGSITAVERYQKLIDIWTTASENLKDEVIQNFQETDLFNPLYMMAFSGARGNISQVRQLVGMRGLMSDSAGGIIDFPIRSNFREGLTVTEYAISCYGARKGLIDTALRTADSGYLTRRLVDVAHGIMIGRLECKTKEFFEISPLKASGKSGSESILLSLEKRILGRVLAENIFHSGHSISNSQALVAHLNQEISPSLAQKIVQYKKETVHVRSPLTCRHFQNLREDICQLCYGWSLAHGRLVSIGEAVGILAAQSIGEPGTQLTMRTFHTGGIFSTDIEAKIFAPHNGFVEFSKKVKGRKIRTFHGQTAFFTFEPLQLKISSKNLSDFSIFNLPAHSLVFVYPGQFILKNILCAEVAQLMSAKVHSFNSQVDFFAAPSGEGRAILPSGKPPRSAKSLGVDLSEMKALENKKNEFKQKSAESVGINIIDNLTQLPDEEEILDEESTKPNSKKVLSEIEGQIYFHRLAERRQMTEFEKFSQVKGVGSLWVLGGKKVFAPGPFQSGDFVLKKKKVLPKLEALKFQEFKNQNTHFVSNMSIPYTDLKQKNKTRMLKIQFYKIDFSKTVSAIPVFEKKKKVLLESFSSGAVLIRSNPAPPLPNPPVPAKSSKFLPNWLQKQQEKPFPRSSIVAFREYLHSKSSFSSTRDLTSSILPGGKFLFSTTGGKVQSEFNTARVRISKKLSLEFDARLGGQLGCREFLKKYLDFIQLNPQFETERNRKQKSKFSTGINPAYFYSFQKFEIIRFNALFQRASETQAVIQENRLQCLKTPFSAPQGLAKPNLSTKLKIFSFKNFGYFEKIFEDIFIWTPNLDNYSLFLNFKNLSTRETSQGFETPFKGIPNQRAKKNSQFYNIQFEHGELRFAPDRNLAKNDTLKTSFSSTPGFASQKLVGGKTPFLTTRGLNLKTSDLRLFKIQQSPKDSPLLSSQEFTAIPRGQQSRPPTIRQKKIGELIRCSDELDTKFSLDKTNQIIRRTLISDKTQKFFYTLRRVHPYLISNNSPLAVSHGDIVHARQFLFELFYQQSKTGDIVQGLPKIEQLFEARRTSLHVIETVHVRLKEKFQELCNEYPLYEAARLSIRFIQRILIDEIQLVYQSQGVDIADKHIEIIIRQMTSKVIIHEKGKSPFFPDDIIDFHQISQFEIDSGVASPPTLLKNSDFTFQSGFSSPNVLTSSKSIQATKIPMGEARREAPSAIVFEPIVLGLTKISFLTQSFISAASFQETKRVLMNSAVQSRVDFLYGLKENVIVGRFIRAGTGFRTSLFPAA